MNRISVWLVRVGTKIKIAGGEKWRINLFFPIGFAKTGKASPFPNWSGNHWRLQRVVVCFSGCGNFIINYRQQQHEESIIILEIQGNGPDHWPLRCSTAPFSPPCYWCRSLRINQSDKGDHKEPEKGIRKLFDEPLCVLPSQSFHIRGSQYIVYPVDDSLKKGSLEWVCKGKEKRGELLFEATAAYLPFNNSKILLTALEMWKTGKIKIFFKADIEQILWSNNHPAEPICCCKKVLLYLNHC